MEARRQILPPVPDKPSSHDPEIPDELIPKIKGGCLVIDAILLNGKMFPRLIINSRGYIIGREAPQEAEGTPYFRAQSVYAIRVRNGFWGRIGRTRWRCVCS